MYRALYDYKSTLPKYLSFNAGDQFTIINTTQKDWYLAQNGFGEVGYVPRNYIAKIDVEFSEVLKSIDRAIEAVYYQTSNGTCSKVQRGNLEKLHQHRKSVIDEFNKKSQSTVTVQNASAAPSRTPSQHSSHASAAPSRTPSQHSSHASAAPSRTPSQHSSHASAAPSRTPSQHSSHAMAPPVRTSSLHSSHASANPSRTSSLLSSYVSADPSKDSSLHSSAVPSTMGSFASTSPTTQQQSPTSPTSSSSRTSSRRKAPSPPKLNETPTGSKDFVTESPSDNIKTTGSQSFSKQSPISEPSNYVVQEDVKSRSDSDVAEMGVTSHPVEMTHSGSINDVKQEVVPPSVDVQNLGDAADQEETTVISVTPVASSQTLVDEEQEMVSSVTSDHQSLTELTVNVEQNIMTKPLFSPIRSQKSFPNSPSRQFDAPSMINMSSLPVPSRLFADLVEEIRRHTGLSHDKSCMAVEVMLSHISSTIPQTATLMDRIMFTFMEQSDTTEEDTGHDATRLKFLFSELSMHKDDSQQRSWALHEDQKTIQGHLDELLSILESAKPSVCRRAVSVESYTPVHNLVEYFQMEVRPALRLSLLQIFGAMCGLEAAVISHLMYSVLPLELVSDILNNSKDVQRLSYVTLVLTMITCTGESFPTNLEDHVNESFVEFVLDLIENPPSSEHSDQTTDVLLNLILSLNLHYQTFTDTSDNTIMKVMENLGALQVFTEKLLVLFNRTDDPCKMFDHQKSTTHSVIKFLMDMYNSPSTANLLYTNDAKVLVDILIRQLNDLPSGDQIRSLLLSLTLLLVTNSDYREEKHRMEELVQCLNHIHNEEGDTPTDKAIAKEIVDFCVGLS